MPSFKVTPSFIRNIRYPVKDIIPCNLKFCKCVEYLNFSKHDHIELYRHCMITAYNNSKYKKNRVK